MKRERPLLIVTSCTRNYGWVTRAFLEGNTRWADYIVIVDQMSTDSTRDLIKEYNELRNDEMSRLRLNESLALNEVKHRAEIVIVDDPDMTYKENTRAKMGFMKGRELAAGRDAIYFALDIDEVMPANWMQTEDGKKILASKPGDMYQLEWANIMPDGITCIRSGWQYKVFHDNGMDWQETGEMQMHTPLLPYTTYDIEPTSIMNFPLLHFGEYHVRWIKYKKIYYQFLDILQHRSKSAVSVYRLYNKDDRQEGEIRQINKEWMFEDVDLIGMVDIQGTPIFVDYIKEIIAKEGAPKFQSIDVWTVELCDELGVKDPRSSAWRVLHAYLRMTQAFCRNIVIRGVDKILKKIV